MTEDAYYSACQCGHGALLHEGEYGCLECACSRMYPTPADDE